MRRLIATLFTSVDGYASGRDPDDMDWVIDHQGPETNELNTEALRSIDLMVMGRVTYDIFAEYWPTASPEAEGDFTDLMNRTPKVVFSSTLTEPLEWKNTRVNSGDLAVEIPELKKQPGGDIGIGGSVELVRSLLQLGLIDRLRLQVYPVALGATGTKPVFAGFDRTRLRLAESRVLDGRVVHLDYEIAG